MNFNPDPSLILFYALSCHWTSWILEFILNGRRKEGVADAALLSWAAKSFARIQHLNRELQRRGSLNLLGWYFGDDYHLNAISCFCCSRFGSVRLPVYPTLIQECFQSLWLALAKLCLFIGLKPKKLYWMLIWYCFCLFLISKSILIDHIHTFIAFSHFNSLMNRCMIEPSSPFSISHSPHFSNRFLSLVDDFYVLLKFIDNLFQRKFPKNVSSQFKD